MAILPDEATTTGQSSVFVNGIDPGFANDLLPLALAGTCQSIEQIRCMEIINYDTYDGATVMFDVMGFGKPLDDLPILLQPGVLSLAWGSEVRQLAADRRPADVRAAKSPRRVRSELAAAGPGRRLVPG